MKIIKPITTLCTAIVAYNVPQDYTVWVITTTYAKGDRVVAIGDTCGATVYESLTSSNTGNDPADPASTDWTSVGVSNYYAMFDNKNSTQTTNANTIEIDVGFSELVNAVGLMNVEAASARFQIWDETDTLVVDETIILRDYGVTNMHDYYFSPITALENYVNVSLPSFIGNTGRLTLDATGGTAKLGSLVYGSQFEIGETRLGIGLGIKDYSTKDRDIFGNAVIVEREYSDLIDSVVTVQTNRIAEVRKTLSNYRAQAVVWVGDETKDYTISYGFYKDFKILLPSPAHADCRLKTESI